MSFFLSSSIRSSGSFSVLSPVFFGSVLVLHLLALSSLKRRGKALSLLMYSTGMALDLRPVDRRGGGGGRKSVIVVPPNYLLDRSHVIVVSFRFRCDPVIKEIYVSARAWRGRSHGFCFARVLSSSGGVSSSSPVLILYLFCAIEPVYPQELQYSVAKRHIGRILFALKPSFEGSDTQLWMCTRQLCYVLGAGLYWL
ncbi:hypothetical protein BVC80_1117g1 [Macleaya cordata]|uniref:Uncharacterized protein n=1 Tax=Macleaya cordata TaxID=56857 RepID=A0A200Q9A3_MACCD|nr:hypothetical protein BVC80_1117g1 [Macleaya cordata]